MTWIIYDEQSVGPGCCHPLPCPQADPLHPWVYPAPWAISSLLCCWRKRHSPVTAGLLLCWIITVWNFKSLLWGDPPVVLGPVCGSVILLFCICFKIKPSLAYRIIWALKKWDINRTMWVLHYLLHFASFSSIKISKLFFTLWLGHDFIN